MPTLSTISAFCSREEAESMAFVTISMTSDTLKIGGSAPIKVCIAIFLVCTGSVSRELRVFWIKSAKSAFFSSSVATGRSSGRWNWNNSSLRSPKKHYRMKSSVIRTFWVSSAKSANVFTSCSSSYSSLPMAFALSITGSTACSNCSFSVSR